MDTLKPWQWYLERAANTTIGMGVPSTGLMDGTVFREILIALQRESFDELAAQVDTNMRSRTAIWNAQEFPYGSEFNWDTTGQEECAVWGAYYDATNETYGPLSNRIVDAILAFQPSVWNWAWHGNAEGWGDFSNNAKWMITGGWEREGGHYRSGLNSIPLGEGFRRDPDEFYMLEVAMGGMTGLLTNINEEGAPLMGFHMHPFVSQHDPNSGDFGLGFFGSTMNMGSYLVRHADLGYLCYLCNLETSQDIDAKVHPGDATGKVTLTPQDAYHRRVYLEPLGLELRALAGSVVSTSVDFGQHTITVTLADEASTGQSLRLEVSPLAAEKRQTANFQIVSPACTFERGAYTVPKDSGHLSQVVISYEMTHRPALAYV